MYINLNSIIALNHLKLSNRSKKLPKLHMNQSMFSIACTNSFEVKPQFNRHFDSKSYRILLNAKILFWDTLVCKHRIRLIMWNLLNFLPQPPHMISWDLENLMIFRLCLLFLEFKNHLATCLWSCFLNKMFKISFHFLGKTSH